ncbi:hypothetical protein CDEST_01388 [Colletotrichum destructivum]|uniref:Uncharacterized protein n=1 Tax=Colletotrichum destructivum TaxID=34406 RepID=A0AAX4I063_9PEZI|nr:hypothetical protein CDEST_01388 [Colletotrichum destructivum]
MLFVNNIGAVTQRLQGMIMGDAIEALPDSGSEPNLLSLDHVVRRGMRELINTNNIRMIQFADGIVQKTMGFMRLNWAYASSTGDDADDEWSEHFVEFHVLEGCAYDKSFVDVITCSEPSGLNLVTWASEDHRGQAILPGASGSSSRDWLRTGRQHRLLSPPSATDESTQAPSPLLPDRLPGLGQEMRSGPSGFTSAGLRHHRREELERRAEAERNYRRMPRGPQGDAAVAEEEECQRRYDMAQLLPPISDVNSESEGALVTTSSAVGAKFVDGRADPGRAASTRESLRKKLG